MCFDDLWIVVANSCRAHDNVRLAHVIRAVTFRYFNAHLLQPVGNSRAFQIRSRNAETKIDQHLGDAGHTDAAYANKMGVLNSSKHG